jgi:predicted ATP-dependent Lon-type protease
MDKDKLGRVGVQQNGSQSIHDCHIPSSTIERNDRLELQGGIRCMITG